MDNNQMTPAVITDPFTKRVKSTARKVAWNGLDSFKIMIQDWFKVLQF